MKCRDCKFLSEPVTFGDPSENYPSIRCTLGLWDTVGKYDPSRKIEQWYSWGESQLNRGPVRRHGDRCTRGQPK